MLEKPEQPEKPKTKPHVLLYSIGFLGSFLLILGVIYVMNLGFRLPFGSQTQDQNTSGADSLLADHREELIIDQNASIADSSLVGRREELTIAEEATPQADFDSESEQRSESEQEAYKGLETKLDTTEVELEKPKREIEGRIKKLAMIYETMRPDDAASIMASLNDSTIIEILLRINKRQAAKILGSMTPERAAALSAKIATSN